MKHLILIALFCCYSSASVITTPTQQPFEVSPQPAYQPQDYVPHTMYPNAETFPNPYDFLIPAGLSYQNDYPSSMMPAPTTALQYVLHFALKLFAKVGLFLVGGVALLFIGGIFTTAVCSLTPLCTITFNGIAGINKETVQNYMTPEKIQAAANIVQDAIGKYERMQRAINP